MLLLFIIFMCSRILMNKTRYKFGYTLRSYSNKCTLLPCITENRYSKSGIFFLFVYPKVEISGAKQEKCG